MRILLVPPQRETPWPPLESATSQITLLAEVLRGRGHTVEVFGSNRESSERAGASDPRRARLAALRALARARDFDCTHSFGGPELPLLAGEFGHGPLLASLWQNPCAEDLPRWRRYRGSYTSVSWAQALRLRGALPNACFAGAVYPALDVDGLPFEPEREDYLLSLARPQSTSDLEIALPAARRSGRRLIVAGPADSAAAAALHGISSVEYRPLESDQQLLPLLARASGMLLTGARSWDLTAATALALGTPVVALDCGPARELVVHAETGFLARDLPGLIDGIERLDSIEPRACRKRAEWCWDIRQAAAGYEAIYERVLRGAGAQAGNHPDLEALDPRLPRSA